MSQPFRIVITNESPEQATAVLTGTIKDLDGTPIPGSALDTMVLTLFNKGGEEEIINGRDNQTILAMNGGDVDEDGLLTLRLDPDDMALCSQDVLEETHVASLVWTYNGDGTTGRAEVLFRVVNLRRVS